MKTLGSGIQRYVEDFLFCTLGSCNCCIKDHLHFNHISQAYYFVTHMNALLHHLSLGSAVGILSYFRI